MRHEYDAKAIFNRIENRRKSFGLTRQDVADRIGVSANTYNHGLKNLTSEQLSELCDLLQCEPSYILGFTNLSDNAQTFLTMTELWDEFEPFDYTADYISQVIEHLSSDGSMNDNLRKLRENLSRLAQIGWTFPEVRSYYEEAELELRIAEKRGELTPERKKAISIEFINKVGATYNRHYGKQKDAQRMVDWVKDYGTSNTTYYDSEGKAIPPERVDLLDVLKQTNNDIRALRREIVFGFAEYLTEYERHFVKRLSE